jgi:hypothetical protein
VSRRTLVTAVAAVALGSGCETNAKGTFFVDKLRPSLTEKLGEVSAIRCPESIPIKNTTVFTCDIELASGRSGRIEVTLDKKLDMKWETR